MGHKAETIRSTWRIHLRMMERDSANLLPMMLVTPQIGAVPDSFLLPVNVSTDTNDCGLFCCFRITGAPFFDHYYTAWYYGERGVGSTLGFGIKNFDASAASSTPVVGSA